jgi:hypothetical protein
METRVATRRKAVRVQLFLTLLVVHESLPIADGTRLIRIVQSMAPACPVLLISGGALNFQLVPELLSPPMYRHTADPDSFDRLSRELIEVLAIRHTMAGPPPGFSPDVVKALSYISTHYTEALQVNTVAEAIGVSSGKLVHLFPAELRVTVKEYVTSAWPRERPWLHRRKPRNGLQRLITLWSQPSSQ